MDIGRTWAGSVYTSLIKQRQLITHNVDRILVTLINRKIITLSCFNRQFIASGIFRMIIIVVMSFYPSKTDLVFIAKCALTNKE
jgi:hypothetical protein